VSLQGVKEPDPWSKQPWETEDDFIDRLAKEGVYDCEREQLPRTGAQPTAPTRGSDAQATPNPANIANAPIYKAMKGGQMKSYTFDVTVDLDDNDGRDADEIRLQLWSRVRDFPNAIVSIPAIDEENTEV